MAEDRSTRTGKIARLPAEIREEVCRRMHDGQTAAQIIAWLHTLPEVLRVLDQHFGEEPISPQNLSEWRRGGYLDWLRRQEQLGAMKNLSDYAFRMAKAAGGHISDGAAAIAGGRILELLEGTDEDDIVGLSLALAKLRDADAKMLRARISERSADQKDVQLDLERKKFQRTTAELFLKWYDDKRAREIAEGAGSKAVKMEQLVAHIFGERPDREEGKPE